AAALGAMRHVVLTVRADALEDVLDRLLPIAPQGVHERPAGEGRVELGVFGDGPGREDLEAAAGAALLEAREAEADDDPALPRLEAFARLPPIGGRIVV